MFPPMLLYDQAHAHSPNPTRRPDSRCFNVDLAAPRGSCPQATGKNTGTKGYTTREWQKRPPPRALLPRRPPHRLINKPLLMRCFDNGLMPRLGVQSSPW